MAAFGAAFAMEVTKGNKPKRPKYSVRQHRAAILYKCPHCEGFNMLERTGQVQTTATEEDISYCITSARWFTCGDCNVPVPMDEAIKRNRKTLTNIEHTLVLAAVIKQDSKTKVYDILERNNHALNPPSRRLVELYDKYYPTDPLSVMEYEENED
ncbi:hypothetical protein SM033_00028 [Vibrio phage vB_VpaM_sm033]|nr:hypothetical protein SM033_00028 [Vibrio phage vB_VpaM_sm033]